jgi:RND family efflux transporter MFP subunit
MITRNEQSPSTGARASVVRALTCALPLLVAALMSACSRTAAQQADPPPPQVTVATVLERDVTEWDEFTGRLEAVDSVAIRPRVSGYISSVEFTEGALVRRGQMLFQIDARPFEADVDRLKAELARARATVQRATSELSRAERLRKDNAISLEEHDRRTAFANESEAQVAAVEAALRAAMLNLEFTRVTSPITGRASRAVITEGNLVSSGPGEATLLTTVVSIDPIYASFDADEQIFLRYQELARNGSRKEVRDTKRPIRLALASDEGFPREGQMDFLDNQVDPQTGTIRGRAVFRNPRAELTPGLFVRLRLSGGGRYRGFLIQDRAVGTDLGKKFVYVVGADDTVEYRTVALGPLIDGLRVVKSGVRPGDRIIVNGLQRVRPGAKVAPQLVAMEQVPGSSGAAPAAATAQ